MPQIAEKVKDNQSAQSEEDEEFTDEQLVRWYKRGMAKLAKILRTDHLLMTVQNMDIYHREMAQLELGSMERIKNHHYKYVTIDTESSEYDSDEENAKNAADDCEHIECHRVQCKRENQGLVRSTDDHEHMPLQ